jgi:hypothetical protein
VTGENEKGLRGRKPFFAYIGGMGTIEYGLETLASVCSIR